MVNEDRNTLYVPNTYRMINDNLMKTVLKIGNKEMYTFPCGSDYDRYILHEYVYYLGVQFCRLWDLSKRRNKSGL